MEKDLILIAKDDELVRKLQDLNIRIRSRAKRRGYKYVKYKNYIRV